MSSFLIASCFVGSLIQALWASRMRNTAFKSSVNDFTVARSAGVK